MYTELECPSENSFLPAINARRRLCQPTDSAIAVAWQRAADHIVKTEQRLLDAVDSAGALRESARYQLATGGKRFRARLALALAAAAAADMTEATQVAAACELLHNASLVHDDLQDRDQIRRFQPTVWKRFGDETALLLGDWLHTRSYALLCEAPVQPLHQGQLVTRFLATTQTMLNGQAREAAFRPATTTLGDYESAAVGKSGALLALAAESALLIAGCDDGTIANAGKVLALLGLAYQIQDDLKDLYGEKEGREAGQDLTRGRLTAPTIAHLRAGSRRFKGVDRTLPTLAEVLADRQALRLVQEKMDKALADALTLAAELPVSLGAVLTMAIAKLFPAVNPGSPGRETLPLHETTA